MEADGIGFVESPVIVGDAVLVVSLDLGHVYRVRGNQVDLVSALGGSPNGVVLDSSGTMFVAQNGGHTPGRVRRSQPGGIQVVTADGRAKWLTQDPVFPTDLCFGPDGLLYVTDSTRNERFDDGRLWRCDPHTGDCELIRSVAWFPNGIAFGPDDNLYVASTGQEMIYVLRWRDGRLGQPQQFARLTNGRPDGLAFDVEGNLLVTAVGTEIAPGSVQVIHSSGRVVDVVGIGDSRYITNLAIDNRTNRIVLTDASAGRLLTTHDHPARGLPVYPFR